MTFGACRPDATILFGSEREVPAVIFFLSIAHQTRYKIRAKPGVCKVHRLSKAEACSFASDPSVCTSLSVHHIPVAQGFRPEVCSRGGLFYRALKLRQVTLPI
jgi:hypothetical protein